MQLFVANSAPRYRPILAHIPDEELLVDPSLSDQSLELLLHKQLFEIEQSLLRDGQNLLRPNRNETESEYKNRIDFYLNKAADLKESDLANYVTHRRIIIDLLESAIQRREDGKFVREDLVHDIIIPRGITSEDDKFQYQSLWLIDERLAFHDYLGSDISLTSMPITESDCAREPDIAVLRLFNEPILVAEKAHGPLASLTVIEIKRPMRSGYRAGESEAKDPILQALDYLRRLREGARARGGRPIPNADQIPGFIYVVADLTEQMKSCCEMHQLTITADGMGYFGYHRSSYYKAYIQVISFDGLVQSAKERNRAFFDKLGLPMH